MPRHPPSTSPDIAQEWRQSGYTRIAGVDEVGRGPLAGPVVAAAVILPAGFTLTGPFASLTDSKQLSAHQRHQLAAALIGCAEIGLAYIPAPVIDAINIRQATLLAMRRAIGALPQPPDAVLIDGRDVPAGLAMPGKAIVTGDKLVGAIAAASIIAKVARDRMMALADSFFPGYQFSSHAGYPTKKHREALELLGLCPLHRRSFGPCKNGTLDRSPGKPRLHPIDA